MGTVCVNRSGRSWPVTRTNGGSDVIAYLNPNDVFSWTHGFNGNDGVNIETISMNLL